MSVNNRKQAQNYTKSRKDAVMLGVNLTGTDQSQLLGMVSEYLQKKQKFLIVTPNPEIMVGASRDASLRRILNSAQISLPDGVGLKFAAKVLGLGSLQVFPGRVFMVKLLELANSRALRIFILGGDRGVIDMSIRKAELEYPHLSIKGEVGPVLKSTGEPRGLSEVAREVKLISNINHFRPDILFIGFGSPKQEKWWDRNRNKLKVLGAMVVGGSLDYYSGYKKVPPDFLSNLGLEWVWRLFREKGHLRRVFRAVLVFPFYVLKEKINSSKEGN